MNIPDMISYAVQQSEHTCPFGLKGAGGIAIDGSLPTTANTVSDATGIRFNQFPLTGKRILEALKTPGNRAKQIENQLYIK